jgi:hypothetical protein
VNQLIIIGEKNSPDLPSSHQFLVLIIVTPLILYIHSSRPGEEQSFQTREAKENQNMGCGTKDTGVTLFSLFTSVLSTDNRDLTIWECLLQQA